MQYKGEDPDANDKCICQDTTQKQFENNNITCLTYAPCAIYDLGSKV